MRTVFLDTVGLIAVWDKADQWHDDAEPVFLKLITSGRSILTTTLVLYVVGGKALACRAHSERSRYGLGRLPGDKCRRRR